MVIILIFSFPPFMNIPKVLKVIKTFGAVSHERCERDVGVGVRGGGDCGETQKR